jgi:hypothetical protein
MNVTVIPSLKKKHLHLLDAWLNKPIGIQVDYPDETDALLDKIIQRHAGQQQDHYNFDSGLKFLRRLFREKELAA